MTRRKRTHLKVCPQCGEKYLGLATQTYCSNACRQDYNRRNRREICKREIESDTQKATLALSALDDVTRETLRISLMSTRRFKREIERCSGVSIKGRTCAACGKMFDATNSRQIYCSLECKAASAYATRKTIQLTADNAAAESVRWLPEETKQKLKSIFKDVIA